VVTEQLLWVANQTDDVVTVLARDASEGSGALLTVPSLAPACVLLPRVDGR